MKQLFFACLITFFGFGLNAQSNDNFSLGPKIGINFANVNSENTDINTGLVFGITSTYSLNEMSGIGVDLLYSQQGFKSGNSSVDLNYVKVPVLYKFFFNKLGDAFRPRLELGLSPGFLLTAKTNDVDVKPAYNSFDIGAMGGLGFNYRVGSRLWLNVDLRADLGLTNLSNTNVLGLNDLKNRTIGFNIGLAYGI
ncbi:MAG TPA: porin family protein [Saprospiraceae bacterium]|nr:porin family protein [Saprospiraceae bacterium]HPN69547.1 porin family protein [Saprospiraceae bacterium]